MIAARNASRLAGADSSEARNRAEVTGPSGDCQQIVISIDFSLNAITIGGQ
jgi:hypothetical protein